MKYTKKPVTIEAIEWIGTNQEEIVEFAGRDARIEEHHGLFIKTLEGELKASIGDFIIKGIKGEFYPCKPDIFAGSYNPANEEKLQTTQLSFGNALHLIKQGILLAREGWNGKNQFVFMRPADELTPKFIYETVKSLPKSLKNFVHNKFKGETHYVGGDEIKVKFTPYLCLFNAQGDVVNGWVPSQGDLMAEDWEVVFVK